MNCLTDYIGLRGCTDSDPISGLYINDLAGISLKSIDAIADNEQINYQGVWSAVQKRAQMKLLSEVQTVFKSRYKLKTLTQSFSFPKDLNGVVVSHKTQYSGLQIDTSCGNQIEFVGSNLMFVSVQSFSVYYAVAGAGGDKPYRITDDFTGEILASGTFNVPVGFTGWKQVVINQRFYTAKINIEYLDNTYQSEQVQLNGIGFGCGCMTSFYGCDCCAQIQGIYDGDVMGSITNGIIATISIGCNFEGLICSNKNTFDAPYLYLLGVELMHELLYTDRLNKYTTIGKTDAEELRGIYQADFEKYLKLAIDGIDLDKYDCCLECNEPVQYKNSMM